MLNLHNWLCGHCNKKFSAEKRLAQHQKSKSHYYCNDCNRFFTTQNGFEQHNLTLHNWLYRHCKKKFSAQKSLKRHQKSMGHCYCDDCDRFFVHTEALRQHRRSSLHASQFYCCDCERDFVSEHALEQHLINKVHTITRKQTSDYVCSECRRDFVDMRALQQHRTSLAHRPISSIKCITGQKGRGGCQHRFSSPSALLHHPESGACPSGVTQQELNAMIRANDADRIISRPDELVQGMLLNATRRLEASVSSGVATPRTVSDGGVILTPSSTLTGGSLLSPQILTPESDECGSISSPISLSTTRCPLCPVTRPPFQTPESLQQHLNSPAHTPRMFHCPGFFVPISQDPLLSGKAPTVIKCFSTLSGLAQHLESGACEDGLVTFHKAVRYIEARLKEMGMNRVKLLM